MKEKTKTTKKEVSDLYLKKKKSFIREDEEVVVMNFIFSKQEMRLLYTPITHIYTAPGVYSALKL